MSELGQRAKTQIQMVAADLGVAVRFIESDVVSGPPDSYEEACYVLGRDEIEVGRFVDPERMLIAFFHEVGHILLAAADRDLFTLRRELRCWDLGIAYAAERGILFTDAAVRWGYERALTYCGHDERENCRWAETVRPMLWMYQQEEKMSTNDSHALMAAEIAQLREKNKKLREALVFLKDRIWAGSISPREFVTFVDKKLEELKED